jgi:hypothetical protein
MIERLAILCAAILAGLFAAPQAQADTVVLEKTALVSGTQSFAYSFQAPSAGTFAVQLNNLAWPERLASLSFAATTATSVLDTQAGANGLLTFNVGSAGNYFAHVAGTAQGALNLGLYSVRISFLANGGPGVVPLPAGLPLLLFGLTAAAGMLRRRKESVTNGA